MSEEFLYNSMSRVWLIEGRARPDRKPTYEYQLKMEGLDQDFGDREDMEIPDPSQYGKFRKVGKKRGQVGNPTTSLVGRYALKVRSDLIRMAKLGCGVDIHLHVGECKEPNVFDEFEKIVILEDADLTSYNTDSLGALDSSETSQINETGDITAREFFEIVPLSFSRRADDLISNEILDIIIADIPSCGNCDVQTDGCQRVFAITKAAGGSPGTPADLLYSMDGGAVWYAHDIDVLDAAEDPVQLARLGNKIVIVSNDAASIVYVAVDDLKVTGDPEFYEVTTGVVSSGEPNAIHAVPGLAFVVGDGGYVYSTDDPSLGLTVLDAGVATISKLLTVHAISDQYAIAAGNDGAIIYTVDGTSWGVPETNPVGIGVNINTCFMRSKTEWWVGTDDGHLYYTVDSGVSWAEKAFVGSGTGSVEFIDFPKESIGYLSHTSAAGKGRLLRTYNAGYSWKVLPEYSGSLLAADKFNAVATCEYDPNLMIAGGLDDNATDGIILRGSA